ncbi:PAP2 superfamily protein [Streptomyces sp. 2132.2]|uniref:phosphatase PAP2 family protein n=1 Tax=Streptomyces sp. 2132.2 TaxID=2485161 RepID=UPI000FABE44B|nr:phosphatase PAP2 family protein [Streptomyces sp. 2132.2]ROQ96015.1 PAP2 superfamily protein [Streptomyces sp. 2132.2]
MTFSPPAPPAFADCTPRQKAARLVSDGLAPANTVVALLLLIGWHGGTSWTGLGWGLLAALFCGAAPIAIIAVGVRRGSLTDPHIRVRGQRIVPMALSLLCVVAGAVLLRALGAPAEVFALVVAMLVGLVSSLLVTVAWQISIHMSVAGGAVMILLLVFGPRVLPAVLIAAAVAWSRLVLRAHTPAQLLAGTALGGTSALTFLLLS